MFRSQSLLANAQTLTPISQTGNKEARELVALPSTPSGGSPKIKKKKDHRLFFSSVESGPQRKASSAFFRFFELSQTPHPVGVGFVGSSPSEAWGVYLCCRPPRLGLLLVPRHLWLCAEPRTPRLQQMARCSVLFFFDNSGMVTDGSEEHFPSVLQNTSTGAQVLISPNPRARSPGTPGYGVTVQP